MALQPFHAVGAQVGRQVFVVRLVEHDQYPLGHPAQKRFHRIRSRVRSGRIVRVRHPDNVRFVVDGTRHRLEVMAVILRRHDDRARAARLRREWVDGKRVLRHDGGAAGPEEGKREELEHVIRAVAEHDGQEVDAVALRERLLQLEAVAVRIARDITERRVDCRPRARPDAARVLVGGELDDAALIETHLARQLGNRLSGLIRRDRAHVGGGKLAGIDQHQPQFPFVATG